MSGVPRDDRAKRDTRVVVLCTEFWPLGAGAHEAAAEATHWVRAVQRLGIDVTVWTPRHHSSWPHEVTLNAVCVRRPATAPSGHWSHFRYLQSVSNWLHEHAHQFDHVVVFGLTDEVIAVAQWTEQRKADSNVSGTNEQRNTRTTAVATGWFQDADTADWDKNRRVDKRLRRAVTRMDRVVVANAWMERQLLMSGVASDRLHRIAGWDAGSSDDPLFVAKDRVSRKRSAREALAKINSDLAADADAPVVLWIGPMQRQDTQTRPTGIRLMVESARILLRRYPDLRIWLVGDGPGRDWVHTELRAEGVRSSVAIPGTFTEIHELVNAVDVAVYSEACQLRFSINQIAAAGIPLVASKDSAFEAHFHLTREDAPVDSVTWYDLSAAKTFRQSVRTVLDDLTSARIRAQSFADWVKQVRDVGRRSEQWLALFRVDSNREARLGSFSTRSSESKRHHA
ncbi:MAG: glycosyltransferase [Planctomycetota bacterium]